MPRVCAVPAGSPLHTPARGLTDQVLILAFDRLLLLTVKVDCFLCVCLLQAKAAIKLSPKQEEIYDFQLKEPFLQEGCLMGPSCGSSCRLELEGLRSTSASSFLRRLRDSEPRPRVSKSDKIAVEGQGTQIWDPGCSRGFFCLGLVYTFCELEGSFRIGPWAIASLSISFGNEMIFLIISEVRSEVKSFPAWLSPAGGAWYWPLSLTLGCPLGWYHRYMLGPQGGELNFLSNL